LIKDAVRAKLFACFNELSNKHKQEILEKVEELVELQRGQKEKKRKAVKKPATEKNPPAQES
jgi:hypothetical protein